MWGTLFTDDADFITHTGEWRKDFDQQKRVIHIRSSKNETSKRVIPLNDSALEAVLRRMTCLPRAELQTTGD
jgi:hypothetical protein